MIRNVDCVDSDDATAYVTETVYRPSKNNCSDKIYISNEFYDCNGLYRNDGDIHGSDSILNDKWEFEAKLETVSQEVPNLKPEYQSNETALNENITYYFINCGGTFPWPVEKFLETTPGAQNFMIYTFQSDNSYNIFYKRFENHVFVPSVCGTEDEIINVTKKEFGSEFERNTTVFKLSIAKWIIEHTREDDFVIFRLEADNEVEIMEVMISTEAIAHVDKYYSVSVSNRDEVNETVFDHVDIIGYWIPEERTYSDTKDLNSLQIPLPGKTITSCNLTQSDELFPLFLYSKDYSANAENALRVLSYLQQEELSPLTTFLPYPFFKFKANALESMANGLKIGLYYDEDVATTGDEGLGRLTQNQTSENIISFRSAVFCTQKELASHGQILEHILVRNIKDTETTTSVKSQYNLNIVHMGRDITHLVTKVIAGEMVTIGDTDRQVGEYLMINLDVERSEYLAVYMVKMFKDYITNFIHCA